MLNKYENKEITVTVRDMLLQRHDNDMEKKNTIDATVISLVLPQTIHSRNSLHGSVFYIVQYRSASLTSF